MKKVFIVHGWEGFPKNHWFPGLKDKLEEKGFRVIIPAMPDPENPIIDVWVDYLKSQVENLNEDCYFIGHSIGCQAIMRYLEREEGKIGGLIFVAGFFNLPNLETEEDKKIAEPWLTTLIDTDKIKEKTNNIVTIFSDNDGDVPLSDSKLFEERLNAKVIVEKEKGHFCEEDGVTELHVVLDELVKMTK
ncbi:hypothetical protein CL616_01140 [archaeon]|nr:hypothetical protein [archaeon]